MTISKRVIQETESSITIEEPMNMNYRESIAWQKGYDMGWKQCKKHYGVKDEK